MKLKLAGLGCAIATVCLGACSETKQSAQLYEEGAGGDGGAGGWSATEPGKSRTFEPVPRAQPTESGRWVVDPRDSLTLYALGQRSMRSRDGGRTWSELDWPEGALSLGFSQAPVPALLLRVEQVKEEIEGKLFESLDDGESWTDTGAVLTDGDDIIVVDGDEGPVLLTWREGELMRSTDKGVTWSVTELLPEPLPLLAEFGSILVSSDAASVVYIGAIVFTDRYEAMVLVSSDGGETFEARPVLGEEAPRLSLDCHGRLYFQHGTSVYRSGDSGRSWENVLELEPESRYFEVLKGVPSACAEAVYAKVSVAITTNLLRLEGAAVTSQPFAEHGEVLDLGGARLLSIAEFGLRKRSDDGGFTWWTAGVNLHNGDLVVSPTGVGSLFVSNASGVYHSDDGGESWQGAPGAGLRTRSPYPDPRDVNLIYTRSIYGSESPWSFVSTDRGLSFREWPVPSAAAPEIPEAIVSTGPGELTVVTRLGAYFTSDGGAHFETLLALPETQKIGWAAIGAGRRPAIYAYVFDDEAPAANRIVASLDGGETWAWSDAGAYVTDLLVAPRDPQVVLARLGVSGAEGWVRSVDGGATWEQMANPGDPHVAVRFDPQPPYALYAAGQRLHRSLDYGETWETITDMPGHGRDFELDASRGGERYVLGGRGLLYKLR